LTFSLINLFKSKIAFPTFDIQNLPRALIDEQGFMLHWDDPCNFHRVLRDALVK